MKKTMFIGIACGVVVMSLFISSFLSSQTSQNVLSAVSARFPQVFGKFRTQKWTLVATGDVIPARSVNYQMTVRNDFSWSIAGIADLLKSGDITLINLESPLIPDCPLTNEGMVFCGDQKFIESLTLAGVDVANLANNHSLNQGFEGLRDLPRNLGGGKPRPYADTDHGARDDAPGCRVGERHHLLLPPHRSRYHPERVRPVHRSFGQPRGHPEHRQPGGLPGLAERRGRLGGLYRQPR